MTREQITMAYGFAHAAHVGQYDRDGRPHMDHVTRVVARVNTWRTEPEADHRGGYYVMPAKLNTSTTVAAAWLHDVVEDNTAVTVEYLRVIGFRPEVIGVVAGLTRPEDPSYMEYIESIAALPGGLGDSCLVIKQSDLEDNLQRSEAEANDRACKRYRNALAVVDAELAIRGYDASRRNPDRIPA